MAPTSDRASSSIPEAASSFAAATFSSTYILSNLEQLILIVRSKTDFSSIKNIFLMKVETMKEKAGTQYRFIIDLCKCLSDFLEYE